MFKYLNKRRKKGQSTLEYAILIIIIIGALMAIQVYIKRGIQGRLKSATDDIGDQFSPGNTNVTVTMKTVSQTHDTFSGGETSSVLRSNEITTDKTNVDIINVNSEFWGKG
ncbi:hypothetical protein MNBD_UNCLBAC01-565 [hydrothermal vent metagenome]|uniref:Uncharacterized protein n=1 Tax=hydrothermal vent metagenome TaxID=652676 RepID=A0A3B1D5M9_9ZZZZ